MIKKIFTIVLLVGITFLGHAQTAENAFSPKKGDKFVSLNLGAGTAVGIKAPLPNLGTYSVASPLQNWQDKSLALNVEFRWMFAKKWALKVMGGVSYGFSPEYEALPGTADGELSDLGEVPNYSFVPESDRLQYQIAVGFDRLVPTKYDRLFFHYGIEGGVAYGRNVATAANEVYSGKAIGESYGFHGAFVTGFQYFIGEAIYTGIEIRPLGYSYTINNLRPQVDLKLLSSDSHNFTFLSNPMIKLGFRF